MSTTMSSHEIAQYMISGEKILKDWKSKGWNIYATQFRIFFYKRGILSRYLVEASYEHISSIELGRSRPLVRLIGAIIMFILGYFIGRYSTLSTYSLIFWVIGIGLLIWFIIGAQMCILHIVGRRPIFVNKELSELSKFIREKH